MASQVVSSTTTTTTTRTTSMRVVPTDIVALNRAFAQQGSRSGILHREPNTILGNEKTIRAVMADKGGIFLGFHYRVTESGKVLMLRDPAKVKDNRRRLRRLAGLVRKGERKIEDFDNCYECIRAALSEGNSRRLLRTMDNFVNSLRSEINA